MVKIKDILRPLDQFGHKIEMNYRNESTYKTAFGGFVSLVVFSIMAVYSLYTLYLNIFEPEYL